MQMRDSEQYESLAKASPKVDNNREELDTGIDLDKGDQDDPAYAKGVFKQADE